MLSEYFLVSGLHIGEDELLRATGERAVITPIPGNHDYELACYPRFVDRLRECNIDLESEVSIAGELAGKRVRIEHGTQREALDDIPNRTIVDG